MAAMLTNAARVQSKLSAMKNAKTSTMFAKQSGLRRSRLARDQLNATFKYHAKKADGAKAATDLSACKTALERCMTCTPSYCDACIKCYGKTGHGITNLVVSAASASKKQVTTFDTEVQLADVKKFDQGKYLESVAAAAGIDKANVEVASVSYHVTVGYAFSGSVTVAQAKTAIAKSSGVAKSKVMVVENSGGGGRRLSSATHTATIQADDPSAVDDIATKSADVSKLTTELQAAGATVTPTVAAAPAKKVKVTTRLKSEAGAAPVKAPSADAVSSQLTQKLGVTATAVVSNEVIATDTSGVTPQNGAASEAAQQASALSLPAAGLLFTLLAT